MRTNEPALVERRQQVLHHHQRVRFIFGEPQAGKRELGACLRLRFVAIASQIRIPNDRSVEPVTHVLEIALERGERNLELVEESGAIDHRAFLQLIDLW
jgi:hypothetical protein